MGVCASQDTTEDIKSRDLERAQQQKKAFDEEIIKLLLLGAGESGKSTLFKQCRHIYGKKLEDHDRVKFIPTIVQNIVETFDKLLGFAQEEDLEITETAAADIIHAFDFAPYITYEFDPAVPALTLEESAAVRALWQDATIQDMWTRRSKYQGVIESITYFLAKLDDLTTPGWIPTHEDLLRCRVRTTGIVEERYECKKRNILMLDVGGQRSERKKWIHCFQNVTGILFVAALSEYDQILFEDHNINRVKEALNLFESIINNSYFKSTTMILFLNKVDLFKEKIKARIPLTIAFPDYEGDNSYDDALLFFKQQFDDRRKDLSKAMYMHVTCATDVAVMPKIMESVMDSVLRERLELLGLL